MKSKIAVICLIFMIMLKTTVYAVSTEVDVKINGKVNNGSTVDIIFNIKDVSKLYAGSLEFTYDPSVMKVESINGGDFIKSNNPKIMEFGGDTAKNGNIADYYFTCVGKVDGFTGSGSLVAIKANVLNQDKFMLYKKNLKIQLVERNANNEMKDIDYTISGDVKDETPPNNNGSTVTGNSSGKDPTNGSGTGTDKSGEEGKGFIANIIDNIKSIFSGSSSKDDAKKQIDNSSVDNNKSNTSSSNNSNDKNSVENKVNTATGSTKSMEQGIKKSNSRITSSNSSVGIIVGVVILIVLLLVSGVLVVKKRNDKKIK